MAAKRKTSGPGSGVTTHKRGNKFAIVDKSTGKTLGKSTTRTKAQRAARLHNAMKHGWKPSGRKR